MLDSKYDPKFGSQFAERCAGIERLSPKILTMDGLPTAAYRQEEVLGARVKGFHFSLNNTDHINPVGNELYFFYDRPTIDDLTAGALKLHNDIGYAKGRGKGRDILTVYCYEIHPDESIIDRSVKIEWHGHFFGTYNSGINGIKIIAPDEYKWIVLDRILITSNGKEASIYPGKINTDSNMRTFF